MPLRENVRKYPLEPLSWLNLIGMSNEVMRLSGAIHPQYFTGSPYIEGSEDEDSGIFSGTATVIQQSGSDYNATSSESSGMAFLNFEAAS